MRELHSRMMSDNIFRLFCFIFVLIPNVHSVLFDLDTEFDPLQCYNINLPPLDEYSNYYKVEDKFLGVDFTETYGMTLNTVSDEVNGKDSHYLIGEN